MKPPICCVCSRKDDPETSLVSFADYRALPSGMPGHPVGSEWFCSKHLKLAQALTHLESGDAIARVRNGGNAVSPGDTALVVTKVRAGTVYKLLLCGLAIAFTPLGLIFGILGSLGADTVKWNGEPVHGVAALVAGPAIGLVVSALFAGIVGSFANLGLWLLSKVRPIRIKFVARDADA